MESDENNSEPKPKLYHIMSTIGSHICMPLLYSFFSIDMHASNPRNLKYALLKEACLSLQTAIASMDTIFKRMVI